MLSITNKDDKKTDETCCHAKEAGRKLREVVDHVAHDARDAVAATEKQIREHPVRSSAIAAGIGFLVGALLRRR